MAVEVRCVEIDLRGVRDAKTLHDRLARALDFPAFYGRNWAAFWDAITGLVELPPQLVFPGYNELAEHLPQEAHNLRQALEDRNQQFPGWACQLEWR